MPDIIFGGIEGGATKSRAVLYNQKGEYISFAEGPHTNHWAIGMTECQKRISDLIEEAKRKANLPPTTVLKSLGLSLSGCEGIETANELKAGMMKNYPNLSENCFVWSDTVAPIFLTPNDGGVVLIAGTGSNSLLINPDGSQFQCGGLGHMLGDEGGAYWLAVKLLKVCLAEQDKFNPPPHGYSTIAVWESVKEYLNIETQFDLLPHFYTNFSKLKIALLTQRFAALAKEGDKLSQWGFGEAGKDLAKYLLAVGRNAHESLRNCDGGLPVVCIGSVWKSWEFMQAEFVKQLNSAEGDMILKEVSLLILTVEPAIGAIYLAAKRCNYKLPKPSEDNYKVLYHYRRTVE